jgi:hypothetical protein
MTKLQFLKYGVPVYQSVRSNFQENINFKNFFTWRLAVDFVVWSWQENAEATEPFINVLLHQLT